MKSKTKSILTGFGLGAGLIGVGTYGYNKYQKLENPTKAELIVAKLQDYEDSVIQDKVKNTIYNLKEKPTKKNISSAEKLLDNITSLNIKGTAKEMQNIPALKNTGAKIEMINDLIKSAKFNFLKTKMMDTLKIPNRSLNKIKQVQEAGNYNQRFMEMAGQSILKSPKKPLPVSVWSKETREAAIEAIKKSK